MRAADKRRDEQACRSECQGTAQGGSSACRPRRLRSLRLFQVHETGGCRRKTWETSGSATLKVKGGGWSTGCCPFSPKRVIVLSAALVNSTQVRSTPYGRPAVQPMWRERYCTATPCARAIPPFAAAAATSQDVLVYLHGCTCTGHVLTATSCRTSTMTTTATTTTATTSETSPAALGENTTLPTSSK